jgi:DNA-binding response OmpR family regulator
MVSPAMGNEHKKTVILLVDDDEDLLLVLNIKLQSEGFETLLSVNGERIFDITRSAMPDIILMDVTLQGIDGEVLCKTLKADHETSAIPIIMFSANHDIREITERCGADEFIAKPLNFADFRSKVNKLINRTNN